MFLFRLIQAILYSIPLSEPRIIGIVFMTPQTYKKTATKPNKIIKNIKKNDNPIKKQTVYRVANGTEAYAILTNEDMQQIEAKYCF